MNTSKVIEKKMRGGGGGGGADLSDRIYKSAGRKIDKMSDSKKT